MIINTRKKSVSTTKPWMCSERGCTARRYKKDGKLYKECVGHLKTKNR